MTCLQYMYCIRGGPHVKWYFFLSKMTTWEHKFSPCIMCACHHVLLYDYWLFFMSKGDKIKDLSVEYDEGARLRPNTQSRIMRPLCSNTKLFENYNFGLFWPKKVTSLKPKLTFFTMADQTAPKSGICYQQKPYRGSSSLASFITAIFQSIPKIFGLCVFWAIYFISVIFGQK